MKIALAPLALAPLALALAALSLVPAGAYGTLEPANEPGTLLRANVTDPAYAAVDGALVANGDAPLSRRIDHRDGNATWQLYDDRDGDGAYDGHDEAYHVEGTYLPNATLHRARVDGNATDHVEITLAFDGTRFRVCAENAQDGLLDGRARGLRCNGDMDRDGVGDVEEATTNRHPLRPDEGRAPLLP